MNDPRRPNVIDTKRFCLILEWEDIVYSTGDEADCLNVDAGARALKVGRRQRTFLLKTSMIELPGAVFPANVLV